MRNAMRVFNPLICLMLLCSAEVFAAAEARLDRTRIAEGETVVLILNSTDDGGGVPDVSPLAKDFDLLSSSQSMQMSMINGRSSSSRGWQFVLGPNRTGKLSVPAIRIGGATTKPLALEVLPAAQAAELGPAPPVLLEAEAEPQRPFVQQKVIYTVRLLSRVPLRQPRISEPQIADAIVEPLGRQTEYSTQRDGQQYRVMERRYAVFPQRSGSLQIDGPVLNAQLPEQNQRGGGQRYPGRDLFGDFDRLFGPGGFPNSSSLFGQTRPIRLRAATQTLDVQPQPAGSPSPWLPAESLTLNDAWSKDPPQLRVGEPITRSVVITAQGLSAAQLPDLELEAPAGIKVYPDKAESQARVDGDTLVARKVLQFALVPERSGSLRLPEIRVAWWDVEKQQPSEARLPAREVTVLPGAAGSPAAGNIAAPRVGSQPAAPTARPQAPPRATAGSEPSVGADRDDAVGMSYWPWVVAILALAWLATTALWLRARRAHPEPGVGAPARPQKVAAKAQPGSALAHIEQACRGNDPAAARQALLEWAAARWPEDPPRRIDSLIPLVGGEVAPVLHELDRSLYAQATQPWDGAAAWQVLSVALTRLDRTESARHKDGALPPLYPQGS
jgi:hypothetical protein